MSRGDDDLSLQLKGPRLETPEALGAQVVARLKRIQGLRNVRHSNENPIRELSIRLDRERAAGYGLDVEDVGIVDDRRIDVRLRLDRADVRAPGDLAAILLFSKTQPRVPIRIGDIAQVDIRP